MSRLLNLWPQIVIEFNMTSPSPREKRGQETGLAIAAQILLPVIDKPKRSSDPKFLFGHFNALRGQGRTLWAQSGWL